MVTFLAFLLLSASFWLLQSVYEETDGSYEVAFVVKDVPENAVFTTALPKTLKITVKDKNIALARYYLTHSLQSFHVDFSRYADEEGNFRVSATELRNLMQDQLEQSSQITAVTPAFIDAKFALSRGKRVPVVFAGDYAAQIQYHCSPIRITPDTVLAYAPEAILDTLTRLYTTPRSYKDLTSSVSETLELHVPLAVKAEPNVVGIHIEVNEYTEKSINHVPVEVCDVPDSLSLKIFPSTVSIRCNIDIDKYNKINSGDFKLQVSYYDILNEQQKRIPIRLREASSYASYARIIPDSVEYIIEEKFIPHNETMPAPSGFIDPNILSCDSLSQEPNTDTIKVRPLSLFN